MGMVRAAGIPERILTGIRGYGALPALPEAAARVARAAVDPEVSFARIERILEEDPVLTAGILKAANSPYFGCSRNIGTLWLACRLLGLSEVVRISVGVSLVRAWPAEPKRDGMDRREFWRHSTACAIAARRLAQALSLDFDGEEFSAGLLHDAGKLVLDLCFPQDYGIVLERSRSGAVSSRDAEAEVFGTDHGAVGHWLLTEWRLPRSLADAAARHHEPEGSPLPSLVHLADLAAHALGTGTASGELLERTPAWTTLQELRGRPEAPPWEDFFGQLGEEIRENRELLLGRPA